MCRRRAPDDGSRGRDGGADAGEPAGDDTRCLRGGSGRHCRADRCRGDGALRCRDGHCQGGGCHCRGDGYRCRDGPDRAGCPNRGGLQRRDGYCCWSGGATAPEYWDGRDSTACDCWRECSAGRCRRDAKDGSYPMGGSSPKDGWRLSDCHVCGWGQWHRRRLLLFRGSGRRLPELPPGRKLPVVM